MSAALRREFQLKMFGFGGVVLTRFHYSHWRLPIIFILLYKFVLALYVDFFLLYSVIKLAEGLSEKGLPWCVFLTNWTYTVLALYLTISCIAMFIYHIRSMHQQSIATYANRCQTAGWWYYLIKTPTSTHSTIHEDIDNQALATSPPEQTTMPEENIRLISGQSIESNQTHINTSTPWYIIIVWVLFDVIIVTALLVSFMYFIFLYKMLNPSGGINFWDLGLHGLNSLAILIDVLLCSVPVRLLHVIYPLGYALIYVLFSVFYWVPDHRHVIYPDVLDWNYPGPTMVILLIAVISLGVLQLLFFMLHQLKVYVYRKVYPPIDRISYEAL